ncbi:MAG: hypothetical protein WCX48_09795 [Bacteroidales bacterium]
MKPKEKKRKKKLAHVRLCPNCGKKWNGVECKHCSFDTGFDPNWDLD